MAFVKFDCSILQSSLWPEKAQRDVFITSLLMAEPMELRDDTPQIHVDRLEPTGWSVPPGWYGFIKAAGVGILHQAMVEKTEGMEALRALGEPDAESKSKKHEGRRMVRIDGGFVVLNYMDYRDRDYTAAERQKRWRERQKNADAAKANVIRANGTEGIHIIATGPGRRAPKVPQP